MKRLVSAGTSEVTAKVAKIDLALARMKHVTPMNDLLEDRRIDYY